MDTRRRTVGRRIQRARRNMRYRSQKTFADAIGIHENSVARAETGDERVGGLVFTAIEAGLNWPEGCIEQYLETGDESLLPVRYRPSPEPDPDDTSEVATKALTLLEVRGVDATTYNQELDRWSRVLADEGVDIEPVRREAHRRAVERLAKRRQDNPASETG